MRKILKNLILGLTLAITIIVGGFLSQPLKAANPTFSEQFPNTYTAQVMIDYFGKAVTDEIDATTMGTVYIDLKF